MYDFNDCRVPLGLVVNGEQLLDFALTHVASLDKGVDPHPASEDIIVTYILNEFDDKEFTEDDIMTRYSELLASHILTSLVNKGLVETDVKDGKILYSVNEDVRKMVNERKDS